MMGKKTVLLSDAVTGAGELDGLPRHRCWRPSPRGISVTWLVAICAMALFCPTDAQSAQISMTSSQGGAGLITIRGELDLSDAIEFMRKTSSVEDAVVVLRSPGGNLLAG